MNIKVGTKVEILTRISGLQPLIWADESMRLVKKTKQQWGTVTKISGGNIMVKPKNRTWECECYENELRVITEEEFRKNKNFCRKIS